MGNELNHRPGHAPNEWEIAMLTMAGVMPLSWAMSEADLWGVDPERPGLFSLALDWLVSWWSGR